MDQATITRMSDEATEVLLNKPGTVSSNRGGWMMISTILIEAWDLYAIAFVLVFIKAEYHPSNGELGLVAAAVQGGALCGALIGGWVADRWGRKKVFILTMVLFIILALAQGFSQNIIDLIIIRFLIGIPLGSDISNGYAYIMESMPKGRREEMGSRWQFMFGAGEVFSIIVVTILYATGMSHGILWRVALSLGAVPALILLISRLKLPETPLSLLHRGKFIEAKRVSTELFDDDLAMLPNEDVHIDKVKTRDFLKVIWRDPIKKRATIFGWISNAAQGAEFTAWGFYLPYILVVAGVGVAANASMIGTNVVTAGIFLLATLSGWVAPLMLKRIGHKGVSMWGFGLAFLGLMLGALSLWRIDVLSAAGLNHGVWQALLVVGACILMWGHYWDASNGMTIISMAAPARFKATASGFGYMFVKGAAFFGAFAFPVMSGSWGKAGATLAVGILSLIGFLSAKFILPEMFNYVEKEQDSRPSSSLV
jgi:hypothetical protein